MPIEVTVRDTDTGETDSHTLSLDGYVVICSGRAYVEHEQIHANGTRIVTIRRHGEGTASAPTVHFRKGYRTACGRGRDGERTSDRELVTCRPCKATRAYRETSAPTLDGEADHG
jgi:hypothetical protein